MTCDCPLPLPTKFFGLNTNIKVVMDMIMLGYYPVLLTSNALYVISADYYDDGRVAYTKFVDDEAVHSVLCYISFKDTLGDILQKGENSLYGFLEEPLTLEVPEDMGPPEFTYQESKAIDSVP
jgi:hypothetical protein